MKTLLRFRIAVAALIVTAVGASASHAAAVGFLLTLTENSSTSLTYTYDGSSTFQIANTSPDNWTVTTLAGSAAFNDFLWDWTEPEEPSDVNEVYAGGPVHNFFTVESDESLLSYEGNFTTLLANNTVAPTPIGFDGGTPIFLKFNDLAQSAETTPGVPDTGSTLVLMVLSAAALCGLHRFLRRLPA
jgi:hypothetical protein